MASVSARYSLSFYTRNIIHCIDIDMLVIFYLERICCISMSVCIICRFPETFYARRALQLKYFQ